ncbi:MAG TPA: hypothetical protein DD811_10120 [Syntrophomonas sp.]|jgi:hypothetical protein|nr:hypothetical protein [Syntrophomonas sp.]
MADKQELESLTAAIDKIIAGELTVSSEGEPYDERQELLRLAQLLARADFPYEPSDKMKKLWSELQNNGQLEDDELDMVAGGLNLNAVLEQEKKKDL